MHIPDSRPPVFQAMFVVSQPHQLFETGIGSMLVSDGGQNIELPGVDLQLETVSCARKFSQFEIAFVLVPRPDGTMGGKIEFNTDIFNVSTMEVYAVIIS